MTAKDIAKKWYKKLNFPACLDEEFERVLQDTEIKPEAKIENYDTSNQNGKENLVNYLYFCEALEEKYKAKSIPEAILLETLKDIVIWTKTWSKIKGELYLGELEWLKRHLQMRLFKLGRLQFCIADSEFEICEKQIKKGDAVVEVHIPEGEPLLNEECIKSLDNARGFFKQYFPEYNYSLFTCHSWLLDSSLEEFLDYESNILKFAKLFTIARQDPSDALLGYLFRWGIKREQIQECTPKSSLAEKIKVAAQNGRVFYESLGYIDK